MIWTPKDIEKFETCYSVKCKRVHGNMFNVKGDLNLQKLRLSDLSWLPPIHTLKGNFVCYTNSIRSLHGSPKVVEGSFDCENNSLYTLDGAPIYIGYSFKCMLNIDLRFTEIELQTLNIQGPVSYSQYQLITNDPKKFIERIPL